MGWTRAQFTSGNAFAKLAIGPLFGFIAGVAVDRFGPRRLMLLGILLVAPAALAAVAVLLRPRPPRPPDRLQPGRERTE